jgi:hypothetical protein
MSLTKATYSMIVGASNNVKDFGAVGDGVNDDTSAIQATIAASVISGSAVYIPAGTYKVSASLNATSVFIFGEGRKSKIQATAAQFDVMTTSGQTVLQDFEINGGWNGATLGLTGNGITVTGYDVKLQNVRVQFVKQHLIYCNNAGYMSIIACNCNAAGNSGLYIDSSAGLNSTTIHASHSSVFSDCNGYGVVINSGNLITLENIICENTFGIALFGNTNRNINLIGVYQEVSTNGFLVFDAGAAGFGLTVIGCYGQGLTVGYSGFFTQVLMAGNTVVYPNDYPNWTINATYGINGYIGKDKAYSGFFDNITIGDTTPVAKIGIKNLTSGDARSTDLNTGASGFFDKFSFGTVACGSISFNAGNTAFNTSSDYRLKENIQPLQNGLETVLKLNPVSYKWKNNIYQGEGFIAHELAEIVPNAVTGNKDAIDEDDNPVYQGIDSSFLIVYLVKAIQELKAEIDAIKGQ